MTRQYDKQLVDMIQQKQYTEEKFGIPILMKPIPDSEEAGVMDPRLYEGMRKQLKLMKLLPKSMFKMSASPKMIKRMRKMFNGIKSQPMSDPSIRIQQLQIKGLDGNQIPLRYYEPKEAASNLPVLYFIHGGGFFAGSCDVIEELVKLIVERFSICAFSVEYRLAPEHPYPKGHEDCYEALKWIYAHAKEYHGDPEQIFVAGDSAGGNLTQYCTTRSLEDHTSMVRGQMLLYPTVNMGQIEDERSIWSMDHYEVNPKQKDAIEMNLSMFKDGAMGLLGELLGTMDIQNSYLTPYALERHDIPPTMVTVGEFDYLKVESLAFAAKLHDLGSEVTTIVYKGLGHAYGDNVGVFPQSEDLAMEMGSFINKYRKAGSN